MGLSTTTILPVAVGITNVTQLIEPTMEEDSGLVAGIVIAVVTVVLILAALVSLTFVCVGIVPLALHYVHLPECNIPRMTERIVIAVRTAKLYAKLSVL
jgi:hypothetical protein